ncbi:immunity protein Imm33 domain-containing protein [Rhizobium dioscoreae]
MRRTERKRSGTGQTGIRAGRHGGRRLIDDRPHADYGVRQAMPKGGTVSWFFYCGEYSDAEDFYQPVHTAHLSELLPGVVKYLRLPVGTRFIIDDQGYEDVWRVE